ncbi:threonine/serine exporter ThrE family protein [Halalkalibacterium halodurans]|uniref:BH0081 protein n=2 Tax=Halalkalibacterium halodurans TaxID=86665 RepID=Q9KGI0_HALH5|nr:threonine/serine exporter ThrE family protein [Halalkalibacterium halodurans]MED3648145.1 threonine/serine exporter ThrE family protein [Halalkalibacterium halodurans]MED4080434.1 threonine/serine exporter ThrE family protein [Halalkalibacterium halodurans]MED4085589.1 threonine/serine exporter ThrE family protein [Halalkalibacterium halodurans]MED4104089.1 threonine/serine exporter ThrE family protein [Halalkalibacterium halodurans]MED4107665.1 threonine/serine exporter ThrE family protein
MVRADEMMDICMLAGEIMLINGAETYRVEETLERMAKAGQFRNVHSFVTTTGIFLSFEEEGAGDVMQMIRVDDRMQDLNKVTLVNQVSREFVNGEIDAAEALTKLQNIAKQPMNYSPLLLHTASGVAGGAFSYLFGGNLFDTLPAFIAGFVASMAVVHLQSYLKVRFFAEFMAAFTGGAVAILLVLIGLGENVDQVIIGTLMPLVPGIPLTNAVRDLISGDLLAGVTRGAECFVTSLSIATGIALAIALLS